MGDAWLGQTRQPTTSEHGILALGRREFSLDRAPVPPDLADLVERFWLVSWDLPAGLPATVTLLPHPCVNLTLDSSHGQFMINGVGTRRFTYHQVGRGRVFGIKFRPGGFAPGWPEPVSRLTDQVVPLSAWWPRSEAGRFASEAAGAADLDALVAVAVRQLRVHRPEPDPTVELVGQIVQALLSDRSISRVAEVAARFGMSIRSLQRLFARYVGVTPKWVLTRFRLHEAAARLAAADGAPDGGWGRVAAELGYFDQSHFIRDFTRAVGMTPAAYAQAAAANRPLAPL